MTTNTASHHPAAMKGATADPYSESANGTAPSTAPRAQTLGPPFLSDMAPAEHNRYAARVRDCNAGNVEREAQDHKGADQQRNDPKQDERKSGHVLSCSGAATQQLEATLVGAVQHTFRGTLSNYPLAVL